MTIAETAEDPASAPTGLGPATEWALFLGCVFNLILMVIWIAAGGLDTVTLSIFLDFC